MSTFSNAESPRIRVRWKGDGIAGGLCETSLIDVSFDLESGVAGFLSNPDDCEDSCSLRGALRSLKWLLVFTDTNELGGGETGRESESRKLPRFERMSSESELLRRRRLR